MKTSITYSLMAIATATVLLMTSCRPSRVYAYKDRPNKADKYERNEVRSRDTREYRAPFVSLILRPTAGFVMNRYQDGRYFHRSQAGYLYWKGYDNRFYLDRGMIRKVRYDQYEYNEWRRGISDLDRSNNPR
ncbi:MAG: hypothetical protein IPP73_03200 [Chitinophagaceae bacterium]|nr:hypothetical protein [Chitinophagaceae bacterium]